MGLISKIFGTYSERELKSIYPIVDRIEALEDDYRAMTDAQLQAKTAEFKERLANGETLDDILPEAFATAREAADRFAADSHSEVGKIKTASQGQFSIDDIPSGKPYMKAVRVVSRVVYYLED